MTDERVFEIGFEQFAFMVQSEKFQHHRIANKVPRGAGKRGNLCGGLIANRLTLLTGQEALVIKRANLPIQGPRAPVLIGSLVHVPETRS